MQNIRYPEEVKRDYQQRTLRWWKNRLKEIKAEVPLAGIGVQPAQHRVQEVENYIKKLEEKYATV
jgi:hypothetical protein